MGGGIAYQSASTGVGVLMKDIKTEQLELGMGEASKLLLKEILIQHPEFNIPIWVVPVEAVLSSDCYDLLEQQLQQVERDINKYGNVRPATLKKLEKVLKEHQNLEGKGLVIC
jgi:hypothetical protein